MNNPPRPGSGQQPGPNPPWHQRRPAADDQTRIARPRPTPPRAYPSPPAYRRPPASHRPPPTPGSPWYLERPPPTFGSGHQAPTAKQQDADGGDRKKLVRWLLVGAGGLAVLIAAAVLLGSIFKLGIAGGTVLDVAKVQAGVLQTLSDPASGYGANTVTDVSCNNGHNPSADKGTTFTCDATVNGAPRHVTVVVSDNHGTYEIDGPR